MYDALITGALFLVLVYIIGDDLLHYRIRNDSILLLISLFGIFCIMKWDWAFAKNHLIFGCLMFAMLFVMYSRGMMGGGDVKLLAIAFLWLGQENSLLFAVTMLCFTALYFAGVKLGWLPYKPANGRTKIPFGPSIAAAWILTALYALIAQSSFVGHAS